MADLLVRIVRQRPPGAEQASEAWRHHISVVTSLKLSTASLVWQSGLPRKISARKYLNGPKIAQRFGPGPGCVQAWPSSDYPAVHMPGSTGNNMHDPRQHEAAAPASTLITAHNKQAAIGLDLRTAGAPAARGACSPLRSSCSSRCRRAAGIRQSHRSRSLVYTGKTSDSVSPHRRISSTCARKNAPSSPQVFLAGFQIHHKRRHFNNLR